MRRTRKMWLATICSLQMGCLYVDTRVPLDTDVSVTRLGEKIGTSSVHSVLWLFAWGDGGTAAAAKNGGITTVTHLDSRYQMYLFGLYSRIDTIAYGD